MDKKIVLIGGGGHCISVIDFLLQSGEFSDIGIVEKEEFNQSKLLGIPAVGSDVNLTRLFTLGYKYAFISFRKCLIIVKAEVNHNGKLHL